MLYISFSLSKRYRNDDEAATVWFVLNVWQIATCLLSQIPHLETRWDYRLRRESCLVNLYPHPSTLSKAYVDLVNAWRWKSFTIIYETNEGLVRLQELLKAHGPSEFPITVRQLSDSGDYRWPKLTDIKSERLTNFPFSVLSIDRFWSRSRTLLSHASFWTARPRRYLRFSNRRNRLEWWAIITAT